LYEEIEIMIAFTLYRLYKMALFYGSPLMFYARLAFSKLFPGKRQPRFQLQMGQGLVEYALVLVLVSIVVIAILALLGPQIGATFFRVKCTLAGGEITPMPGHPIIQCFDGATHLGNFHLDTGEVWWP
jgi:pilus assembly protein Flp/PilA